MKKILLLSIITILMSFNTVFAENCYIICDTEVNGTEVTVNGQIQNATGSNQVALMVGEPENIKYIDQATTSANGEFLFDFKLWENVPKDGYNFKIGSDSGADVYIGKLYDMSNLTAVNNKFVAADLNITINSYVPEIWGEIYCLDDTETTLKITNKTDNAIIAEETFISEGNVYYPSYTLPSLLSRKEYEITVISKDANNNILADMSVILDAKILSVDVTGEASTASDVVIDAQLKSTNTGLIDKETSFTGNKVVDVTVPNIMSNASFEFFVDGYKTVYVDKDSVYSGDYELTVTGEEEIPLFDVSVNVFNLDSISDKTFTVEYPTPYLYLHSVEIFSNITVIENKPGILKFKVNESIPENKLLTKTVNILKFYSTTAGTYTIDCGIQGEVRK